MHSFSFPLWSECVICFSPASAVQIALTSLFQMGAIFLSQERQEGTAQKTVTFALKQKVYFLILCKRFFHCRLSKGSGSVCLLCFYLLRFFLSMRACSKRLRLRVIGSQLSSVCCLMSSVSTESVSLYPLRFSCVSLNGAVSL